MDFFILRGVLAGVIFPPHSPWGTLSNVSAFWMVTTGVGGCYCPPVPSNILKCTERSPATKPKMSVVLRN